jgi:hypothetical protein
VKFALRFPFVADPEQQANNVALIQAVNTLGELEFIGTGSPNGVVTASPPATVLEQVGWRWDDVVCEGVGREYEYGLGGQVDG